MAVSTDLNPGTSPFASIRLAMNQACVLFGLSPEEALAGTTRHAAQALGRGHRASWRWIMSPTCCCGISNTLPKSSTDSASTCWPNGYSVASVRARKQHNDSRHEAVDRPRGRR
jgi:hypothetical protein